MKTSGSGRGIAISERVVAALVRERARQAEIKGLLGTDYLDNNLVVCRENGAPWDPDNFTHVFRLRMKQLGHDRLRFHDLRHMHATLLIAGGVHAKVASARLGHSQIGITMNLYGHVVPGLDRQAVDVFDRALDKPSGTKG